MIVTLLRAFSLVFLTFHAALYFPGLLSPLMAGALVVVAFGMGLVSSSWRFAVAGAAGLVAFLALRGLLVVVPAAFAGAVTPETWLDSIPLWSERHLTMTALPMVLAWFQGWWHRASRPRLGAERVLNAVLLAAVFWAQGPYHVTLYPVPLALGLALLLFFVAEFAILVVGRATGLGRRTWWALSGLIAILLVTVSVLWSLFGAYEELSTVSGGGLMKPDLFQFDFSSLVKLESEISLSDHLVLLYREPGPGTKRYLRRFVLSGYDPSKGFFVDPHPVGTESPVPPVGRRPLEFPRTPDWKERLPVQQEYFLVNLDPSSLVALNAPSRVQPFARWDASSFVNAYRVDSQVAPDLYWELADAPGDGLDDPERRRNREYGNDPELRALAVSITEGRTTNYDKALAIQNWLKSKFLYSLKPGVPGPKGALKTFLFETRKGYCSYFAFSMALLLRSLDVPARVSVGFLTNPAEKVLDFYPVRAFQAHAWVEVPFGPYGWIDFDPTSEVPAPGENLQMPKGMDPQELTRMISEILKAQPQVLQEPAADGTPESVDVLQSMRDWSNQWGLWLLFGLAVAGQEVYRHRHRLGSIGAPPRARAEAHWRRLRWRARQVGEGPQATETPTDWANRIPEAQRWIGHLERARYAPAFSSSEGLEAARTAGLVFTALSRRCPPWERATRAVLPWLPSLRRGHP